MNLKSKIYKFLYNKNLLFIYNFYIFLKRLIFFRKRLNLNSEINYEIIGEKHFQSFSGYYDLNPISKCENYLLFHQLRKNEKIIDICVYDLKNKKQSVIFKTAAWSWQLGSRLQWYGDNNEIILNYVEENCLKSIILNINGQIKKKIRYPIFSLNKNNNINLFLNFKSLYKQRPGYGYNFDIVNYEKNIFLAAYDLKNDQIIFEITLNRLLKNLNLDIKNENYYFNHLSWNKNGSSFLVYLVSTSPRISKLIYFKNFMNYKIINDINLISHHVWIDNEKIFFYGKYKNQLGFFIFDFQTNEILNKFNNEFLKLDGHPNSINGEKIVIDTYPNYLSERNLYTIDLSNNYKCKHLCSFYSSFNLKDGTKCDLHPKYSDTMNKICVDTSHNNFRQVVVFDNIK